MVAEVMPTVGLSLTQGQLIVTVSQVSEHMGAGQSRSIDKHRSEEDDGGLRISIFNSNLINILV
jgi:hypothetical protein